MQRVGWEGSPRTCKTKWKVAENRGKNPADRGNDSAGEGDPRQKLSWGCLEGPEL